MVFTACNQAKNTDDASDNISEGTQTIFPVTAFLKGQLMQIDSMAITPLKITTVNGKKDSAWLKREDIRPGAAPFLTPLIDSAALSEFFSEKSFLDQTINAFTFSYDPKIKLPDSIKLTHWDVYINPQTTTVQRIYLVKKRTENDVNITTQLTWIANKWYSIRTITQARGQAPQVREEKMIWDFNN